MYISQNIEWLILFCSSLWCIHWPSRRFSPQLWRFVIKMSILFFCMFVLAFDCKKKFLAKKISFSLIWFSCNIMMWFINVLNCSHVSIDEYFLWYNFFFYFQYMVNRIHNNYALQVRAITLAYFMPYKIHQWLNGVMIFHFFMVITVLMFHFSFMADRSQLFPGQSYDVCYLCHHLSGLLTGQTGRDGL